MALFTMGNAITMHGVLTAVGDLVGTLVLWYSPKQYNTFVTNILCFTKNAIKFDYQYN